MKHSSKPSKAPESPRTGALYSRNVLGGLPQQHSARLLASAKSVSIAPGDVLFQERDAGDGCYWIQRGILKVSVGSAQGQERVLAILGPGSIVGELSMMDGLSRSATVTAISDCDLSFVSHSAFTGCLNEHPEVYSYLVSFLVSRLREADEEAAAASFLSVKARVARALLKLVDHLGEEAGAGQFVISSRFRQSDLAAMAGVARENVSRTLTDWQRRHVVVRTARSKLVVHKARLTSEAIG